MSNRPVLIKRYPNRRYYAKHTSKYVSLQEIEQIVQAGQRVEIRDSQTGDDLTRGVLTQIIMERHPDKMSLFPTDLLHFILRSNDVMSELLGDYFRHSLTYLDYLQRHSASATSLVRPMRWFKTWLDEISSASSGGVTPTAADQADPLGERVKQVEERLRLLEAKKP